MRKIIVHYHLFKNAGTSIDKILKTSFGDKWHNWDLPIDSGRTISSKMLGDYINEHPNICAVSSHDARPPLPIGNFHIYPVLFIRNPIIRAKSAYLFEWKKSLGLDSPRGTFAEYVQQHIPRDGASVIANFQAEKLSNLDYGDFTNRKKLRDYEVLDRAKLFIDSIPYFGLVEHFHQSLVRLHYYLSHAFPELSVVNTSENVTQDTQVDIDARIELIKDELGDDTFELLEEKNQLDLALYRYCLNRFFGVVPKR